jgi:hypothetical protein
MSKLLDDAVRVLPEMPEDMQAAAARAIIEYGAGDDDDLTLSDDQVREVERRMADPNRSFMSPSDVRHRLRHFGYDEIGDRCRGMARP